MTGGDQSERLAPQAFAGACAGHGPLVFAVGSALPFRELHGAGCTAGASGGSISGKEQVVERRAADCAGHKIGVVVGQRIG